MFIQIILASVLLSVSPSSKCRAIGDSDMRSFADSDPDPIVMDMDGDGKADTITSRFVVTHFRDRKSKLHQAEWLVFDLKTSQGRAVRSFFKYHYGNDKIDYWVWWLAPCKVNNDGRRDLVFYAGDDTSDETVVISNQPDGFRVISRKKSTQQ